MRTDRQSPRRVADKVLTMQVESNNHAILLNISDQGLGFHALNPLTQSGAVRFSFSEDGRPVEASGELVWIDSARRTGGLSLASVPQATRDRILNWAAEAVAPAGATIPTAATPVTVLPGPPPAAAPSAPAEYVRPSGLPLPQPIGPGFIMFDDEPQESRTRFFPGFVTGVIVAAILAGVLIFVYGVPTSALLARVRAAIDAAPGSPAPPSPLVSAGNPASPPAPAAAPDATPSGSPWAPPSGGTPETSPAPVPSAPAPADSKEASAATPSTAASAAGHAARVLKPSHGAASSPSAASPKVADSGDEDLALAQRYLNGRASRGTAARFLWAAVEKGNATAEITLADLYARGDGVPKSCDQARVLLGAAAGKGGSEASLELAQVIRRDCR